MMWYSIEPRNRIFVKIYGFLSFAKNMGTHATKVAKNLNDRYSRNILDSAKTFPADAIKTVSKRVIQNAVEANGDLIGNRLAYKIASVSKKSSRELQKNEANNEIEISKERYLSPEKIQQIIDELRLI